MIIGDCLIVKERVKLKMKMKFGVRKLVVLPVLRSSRLMHFLNFFFFSLCQSLMHICPAKVLEIAVSTILRYIYIHIHININQRGGISNSNSKKNLTKFEMGI